jgi:SAM-dependent methyltransferase
MPVVNQKRSHYRCIVPVATLLFFAAVLALSAYGEGQTSAPIKKPDVVYVPTPHFVVDAMLKMAKVTSEDVVYDLGCGDGRILIEAAKTYNARGVGLDVDPKRIMEARSNARKSGVLNKIAFRLEDLFEADISRATVVTIYLLPDLNLELRPKLWKDLAVGTRVVSHGYDMGDWVPDEISLVVQHPVYLWTITEEVKQRLHR